MRKNAVQLAVWLGVACAFPAGGSQPLEEGAKAELKKLEGTWKIIAAEMGGNETAVDKLGIAKLVFKGDKMTFTKLDGTAAKTFGFTLDPSKKPKAMDWISLDDKNAKPLPAIYALEGDELKLCFPLLPKKGENTPPVTITRPEGFDTKDRPIGMFVAKREKP